MVASVPEDTNRTRSIDRTASTTAVASSTSSAVGAPKLVPPAAVLVTASTTRGWAWPAINGPHESTQST